MYTDVTHLEKKDTRSIYISIYIDTHIYTHIHSVLPLITDKVRWENCAS